MSPGRAVDAPPAPALEHPAPGVGRIASAAVPVLCAWGLGVAGPVLRVAGNGSNGARGAVVLAAGGLALAAVVATGPLRRPTVLIAAALTAAATVLGSVGLVGRLPGLLTVAGVAVASLAVGTAQLREDRGRPDPVAAVLALIGGVAWWRTGSPAALAPSALAGIAAARAAVAPRSPGPTPLERFARRLVGTIEEHAAAIRRLARRPDRRRRTAPEVAVLRDHWTEALAAVVGASVVGPVIWRMASQPTVPVRGVNDYWAHWERVVALTWSPFFMSVPHPGFHVGTQPVAAVLSPAAAMTTVIVLAVAATGVVLVRIGRSTVLGSGPLTRPWALVFAAVGVLGASPSVLLPAGPSWWQRPEGFEQLGRGAGHVPLHIWGSPTITLAMPMYLALVPAMVALRREPASTRLRILVVGLTLLATLTMPAGTLGLVPAAGLAAAVGWWCHGRGDGVAGLRRILATESWLLVPGSAVVIWQMWFLATSQSPLEEATWRWSPFWMLEYFELGRPAVWALALVPLTAWAAGARAWLDDPAVRWCLGAVGVAWLPAFLFQETGWKATHGGLAVSFYLCSALLVVFSIRCVLVQWQDRAAAPLTPARSLRLWVAMVAVAAVQLAGIVDLVVAYGGVPA